MGFGNVGDRPDLIGVVFDLPDVKQEEVLVIRMSSADDVGVARPGRARALVAVIERYGTVMTFDIYDERHLPDELHAQSFGSVDLEEGNVLPRVCSVHRAWYRSVVGATGGTPSENLPPLLYPESWTNAPGGIR